MTTTKTSKSRFDAIKARLEKDKETAREDLAGVLGRAGEIVRFLEDLGEGGVLKHARFSSMVETLGLGAGAGAKAAGKKKGGNGSMEKAPAGKVSRARGKMPVKEAVVQYLAGVKEAGNGDILRGVRGLTGKSVPKTSLATILTVLKKGRKIASAGRGRYKKV